MICINMMNATCAYDGARALVEQITINNTPIIPYKGTLPSLHAWKRSFMKMALKSRKKHFPSLETEVLLSEIHKKSCHF